MTGLGFCSFLVADLNRVGAPSEGFFCSVGFFDSDFLGLTGVMAGSGTGTVVAGASIVFFLLS